MKKAASSKAAPEKVAKKRGPKPFADRDLVAATTDRPKEPHKYARRTLPPIERPAEVQFPLVYQNKNKHPRNGQRCRECPTVAAPEKMIAIRFEDGTNLVALRTDVHSQESQAGTEPARKFWGTR
jgi:hypothetical protein